MERLCPLGFCHNIPIKIYTVLLGSAIIRWVPYSNEELQFSMSELVDIKEGYKRRDDVVELI